MTPPHREIWQTVAHAIRPPPAETPSEFAEKYRVLHRVYCTERPGRWDASTFPYQGPLMNLVQEAIETGRRGVIFMKSGQGGGTDLAINIMCWLKRHYPGPQLFLTSTEDVATEFGRERWEPIIRDCPPLAAKYRPNARGDHMVKRFSDGKIQLAGGQSIFSLTSTPYRHVCVDEVDSLTDNLSGEGDPMKIAEVRLDSYVGETMIVGYAHPTTKDRGAARLFFESSDQRRGFVRHASCGGEFWLQWDHVKCLGDASDAGKYFYGCPNCGEVITDAERVAMVRNVEYRSVLPPDQAKAKPWIGGHFSQLYYPGKTIRSLAQRWIACGDNPNAKRVFVNKVTGEPYEAVVKRPTADSFRALISVRRRANDPEFYSRGQVPPGVRFLTAGQDSRSKQFHYAIWGWGLRRRTDKATDLCAWLIDWGEIQREYSLTFSASEYHVFDDLIYRRWFPSTDGTRSFSVLQCGHDIGWQPTQIPIITYIRSFPNRAFAIRGASETPSSAVKADYMKLGNSIPVKIEDQLIRDSATQPWYVNSYQIKCDWHGMVEKRIEVMDGDQVRKVPLINLPEDVDERFIEQSCSEYLAMGEKKAEMIWKHKGPNHFADCSTYSHGLALNVNPFQDGMTAEEHAEANRPQPAQEQSNDQFRTPDGRPYLITER